MKNFIKTIQLMFKKTEFAEIKECFDLDKPITTAHDCITILVLAIETEKELRTHSVKLDHVEEIAVLHYRIHELAVQLRDQGVQLRADPDKHLPAMIKGCKAMRIIINRAIYLLETS